MSRNVSGGRFMSIRWAASTIRSNTICSPRWHAHPPQGATSRRRLLRGGRSAVHQTSLWQSYRVVIRYYLNSVGLRGRDPFLRLMVAQRRAL